MVLQFKDESSLVDIAHAYSYHSLLVASDIESDDDDYSNASDDEELSGDDGWSSSDEDAENDGAGRPRIQLL